MSTLVEHQTLIDDLIKIRYRNGKFGQILWNHVPWTTFCDSGTS